MTDEQDVDAALRLAVKLCVDAAALARRAFIGRAPVEVDRKGVDADLVTSVDQEADALIRGGLLSAFPRFGIQSEESGFRLGDTPWRWVVDPLDGTHNFVAGIPSFGSAIALYHEDVAAFSVIVHGMTGDVHVARQGCGVVRCGSALRFRCRPIARPADETVSLLVGYDVAAREPERVAAAFERLHRVFKRVLLTWSPTYDWVLFAKGDVAAVVVLGGDSEDLWCGIPFAEEAGGVWLEATKGARWPSPLTPSSFVACHPADRAYLADIAPIV